MLFDDVLYFFVSEACQINDLDHTRREWSYAEVVSEACQINDLDHSAPMVYEEWKRFRSLSDQ